MSILFGLFGTGGFAREVMPIVAEMFGSDTNVEICFVETKPTKTTVNNYRVLSEEQFLNDPRQKQFNVAIADFKVRKNIVDRCLCQGAVPVSLVSKHAVRYWGNEIADGAILCAFTTITSDAVIGRNFHLNIYSYVAHDCVIGDDVTFAPQVHCNGSVVIENNVYVGTGAIIKQGTPERPITIGEGAVIGMGAVVTKSVPAGVTVVGNPARDILELRNK